MRYAHALTALVFVTFLLAPPLAAPRSPAATDSIKLLSGCFDVTYIFIEDGEHDAFAKGGPIKTRVGLWRGENGRMILPHASITPDNRAVAHWHEIWTRRPQSQAWTREVWRELPASPGSRLRYTCTAPWTMNRWQCHAGRAPKPFRDAGAPFGFDRMDYAWLDREDILLVTEKGWIHNEHNKKVDENGAVVSHELGWITYRRIAEDQCEIAVKEYGREKGN